MGAAGLLEERGGGAHTRATVSVTPPPPLPNPCALPRLRVLLVNVRFRMKFIQCDGDDLPPSFPRAPLGVGVTKHSH